MRGCGRWEKDSEIIEMIGALFDIESHKIKITRMTAGEKSIYARFSHARFVSVHT